MRSQDHHSLRSPDRTRLRILSLVIPPPTKNRRKKAKKSSHPINLNDNRLHPPPRTTPLASAIPPLPYPPARTSHTACKHLLKYTPPPPKPPLHLDPPLYSQDPHQQRLIPIRAHDKPHRTTHRRGEDPTRRTGGCGYRRLVNF